MSSPRIIFACCCLSAVAAIALIGCDREKREFRGDPSMSTTQTAIRLNAVVAGLPPATSPAESNKNAVDPNEYERNAFHLGEGQRLFEQMNCGTCHAAAGGGDIGPTLNDDSWIYGHEPQQIVQSIIEGRPNGMPSYGPKLSQAQVWQLAAYVRSLSGLVPQTIAPSRQDHMHTGPAPNSTPAPTTEKTEVSPSAGKDAGSK